MAAKRRKLTTDDLLRMQEEGPSRKRVRHVALLEDSDGSDEEFEQVPGGSENDEQVQDDSGSGSESGSGEDSEGNSEEDESEDEDIPLPPKALVEVDEDEERRGRTCFIVQFTLAATASGCLQVVFTHR